MPRIAPPADAPLSPLSLLVSIDETVVAAQPRPWVEAITASLAAADDADAAWACWLLLGHRLPRAYDAAAQRRLCARLTGHSDWLLEAARDDAGNWPEALALVLNAAGISRTPEPTAPTAHHGPLADWVEQRIAPLAGLDPIARDDAVARLWRESDLETTLLLNRMLAGTPAVRLPRTTMASALAGLTGYAPTVIEIALEGFASPTASGWRALRDAADIDAASLPVPPTGRPVWHERPDLPPPSVPDANLRVEPCPPGQRCQLVRSDRVRLWRQDGTPLAATLTPALTAAAERLPRGCVLDGWWDAADTARPIFRVVDVLRQGAQTTSALDIDPGATPLRARLDWLEAMLKTTNGAQLRLNTAVGEAPERALAPATPWLIRRLDAPLESPTDAAADAPAGWLHDAGAGRVIAALGYARFGPGGRSAQIEEFTFVVPLAAMSAEAGIGAAEWVPIARVPAPALTDIQGLDAEVLTQWIRANASAKYGPVRQLPPLHLFELSGVPTRSKRHRAGLMLADARVVSWLPERPPAGPTTVATLAARLTPPPD